MYCFCVLSSIMRQYANMTGEKGERRAMSSVLTLSDTHSHSLAPACTGALQLNKSACFNKMSPLT